MNTGEEAAYYGDRIIESASIRVHSVLELGSGGGNNASYMKQRFTMVLSDMSPEMLEASRSINPELEHILGDMCTLRIPEKQFDAVFVHDAVSYLTSEREVRAMASTAALHCRPRWKHPRSPGPCARDLLASLHRLGWVR